VEGAVAELRIFSEFFLNECLLDEDKSV